MKNIVRITILCLCAFFQSPMAVAETLVIPGSGNPEFVLGELANAFNAQQKQHRVVIPPTTGSAGALRDLADGSASIGRLGRPLKNSERGAGLIFYSLGRDPVAFVGGANVSVRTLTRAQIVDIYAGKLTNWRDLGDKPGPVRVIGREASDASRQAIARNMEAFLDMDFHATVKLVHLDPQMIELLDRYPTSIGFMNRSALSAAKTKLVLLELDSVAPSPENVAAGHYPIHLEFGLAYKTESLTEAGRAFLKFIDSPEGARILRTNGIVQPARGH